MSFAFLEVGYFCGKSQSRIVGGGRGGSAKKKRKTFFSAPLLPPRCPLAVLSQMEILTGCLSAFFLPQGTQKPKADRPFLSRSASFLCCCSHFLTCCFRCSVAYLPPHPATNTELSPCSRLTPECVCVCRGEGIEEKEAGGGGKDGNPPF